MTPRIAFCTTCKGRAQHLKITLPKNLSDNEDHPNVVFVIVDYGSRDDLAEWLKRERARDIERGRVVLYRFDTDQPFHMAHAKNIAHRAGIREGADVLVNLDADNLTGWGFARFLADQFQGPREPSFFLWANMKKGVQPRGINGRIVVSRNAFLKVGGYDEQFNTWSPDDKDFNRRLRRAGYEAIEIPPEFLDGLRHNDKMRFREYPHAAGINYALMDVKSIADGWTESIVNFSRCGIARLTRNFSDEAIEFGPLPTRIFGIGMHKTGTTSLHEAFRILGFESVHWPSAHWAKAVWEEVKTHGRSLNLERYYAATDLPLPLLYRELDRAYPGAKFVLTVRDEQAWLRSVQHHFTHDGNPYRAQWDHDPFSHTVHKELYGRKSFDADTFLARYRQHNAEVKEYFKNRPQDLLVLGGPNFNALANFLRMPKPTVPYPHANGGAK